MGIGGIGNFGLGAMGFGGPSAGWSVHDRWWKPLSNTDLAIEVHNESRQCKVTIIAVTLNNYGELIADLDPVTSELRGAHE